MAEVDEKFDKFVVLPELRFVGAGGATMVAKDVLVLRVDSLESDMIGQAIMFRGPIKPLRKQ